MTTKVFWLFFAAEGSSLAKMTCFFIALLGAGIEIFGGKETHPWTYYVLLIALSFSFLKLQRIFEKGYGR